MPALDITSFTHGDKVCFDILLCGFTLENRNLSPVRRYFVRLRYCSILSVTGNVCNQRFHVFPNQVIPGVLGKTCNP